MNRAQKWQRIEAQCSAIIDKLGRTIDDGILPVVVSLNAHGFTTTQSCQGHLDRGIAAPWVDIRAKQYQEMIPLLEASTRLREEVIVGSAKKEFSSHDKQKLRQSHHLETQAAHMFLQEQVRLIDFLGQFYHQHQSRYDTMLVLKKLGWYQVRLQSIGTTLQEYPTAAIDQRLPEYQSEMTAFGEFLKQAFMKEKNT